MTQSIKIGTYTGNGSCVSIITGFPPDFIEVFNASELWKWQTPMSSGAALGIRGATGSLVRIESKGIVQLTRTMYPSGQGFRCHSSASQSGNTYYYRAMRG